MSKPLPPITLSAKQVLVGKLCGERPGFAKARWLIHVPEHNCVEIVDGTLDKDERIEVLKRGARSSRSALKKLGSSCCPTPGCDPAIIPREDTRRSFWSRLFLCALPFWATLVSSIRPVSVRLGQHHRTLVMRHVEGTCDVTDAFSTVLF